MTAETKKPSTLADPIPAVLTRDQKSKRTSAVDWLAGQPWAITPEMLETIAAIAAREGEGVEAVAARLGRPLQNTRSVEVRGETAIVPITGPIMRYANLFTEISGATSLEILARDFSAAVENPAIKSIVLAIDSPGGQASGIAEFAQMVRTADKEVVAYVDGMGASAAYWIASAAKSVILSKTAMVGSIGAVIGISTRKDDGVIEIVSSQSPNKRPDPSTDEGRTQIQARLDALAQVFVADVAAYRGVSVETVLADFGRGDLRMGEEAVALGMADRVSTLETVIAGLAGSTRGGGQIMATENGTPAADKPDITREYLEEHCSDLVVAIRGEGVSAGADGATTDERARVMAILNTPLAGAYHAMAVAAIAEGDTPESFALAILSKEQGARANTLNSHKADAHAPVSASTDVDLSALPIEDQCRAKWDAEPKLRAEFGESFSTYMAFARNHAKGSIRILSKGAK